MFFDKIPELAGHGWDCRLMLSEISATIEPGHMLVDVPVVLLSPNEVLPHLYEGAEFRFWEMGDIGTGIVTEIAT